MHYGFVMSNSLRELDATPPGRDGRGSQGSDGRTGHENPDGDGRAGHENPDGDGRAGHEKPGADGRAGLAEPGGDGRATQGGDGRVGHGEGVGGERPTGSEVGGRKGAGNGNGDGGGATVQSVDRAVSILEILARSGESGVTDIARELGVHKSTAFRLVAALERRDLVEQLAGRGKYRLGTGILRLAGATTSRLDLVQESRGVARQLAQRTGETVNVAVLSDGAALYMDQVAGSSALQPHNWVGQRIPLHATSNGKVLLSALDDPEVRRQVPHLRSYTPHTITTFDDLSLIHI